VAVPIIIGITSEEALAWNQGECICKKRIALDCNILHRN
jgi:hypothetical protein